ncbi:winged helix-turn-helix transcriptional regulator [Pseudonocardia sp. CA-107938]|uniref:winged helix-turn-helix transcriptional regulator n=1 Tax=Pseudonocardia sp. CA-107938 TaxID=3240021 RepID=UPI003D911277
MRSREYGQFCGLARAAEVLGQRWALLILRDLLVRPRRYSDLLAGLPGIPTNMLATRLKEFEQDGLVVREARRGADRAIVYRATERAEALAPAFAALARWGAADMREPRPGEVFTEAALVSALRSGVGAGPTPPRTYQVVVGDAIAHAVAGEHGVDVRPGSHPAPDLTINAGLGFRDVLAHRIAPDAAVAEGAVELTGDRAAFADFVATFHVPLS